MKNILPLLFAWPICCFSQITPQSERETHAIAEMEKNGALNYFHNKLESLSSNNFDIHHYRCEWQVDPNVRYIKGIITSAFSITSATNTITFDCSDQLNIDSV